MQAANGKFDIENCTPKEARSVEKALQQGQLAVQKALVDIHNGQQSRYGLWAMFKSNDNIPKVKQMLQDLVVLKPMPNVLRNEAQQASSPVFLCVSKGSEVVGSHAEAKKYMDTWYEECKHNKKSVAMYVVTAAYIFLCPNFFRHSVAPPPTKSAAIFCPIVQKNTYRGNFEQLLFFQSYTLLHELIHFYLGDKNGPPVLETYGPNNLVSLSAAYSWRNPRAYEYYITCKFRPSRFL